MSLNRRFATVLALILGVILVGQSRRSAAQEDPRRKEFMRLKLETAKSMVEGIALENYDLLEKNAKDLRKLSMGAEWETFTIPKIEYVAYTSNFQRAADELRDQAKAKNIDGVVAAYGKLTTSCVQCHKETRKKK